MATTQTQAEGTAEKPATTRTRNRSNTTAKKTEAAPAADNRVVIELVPVGNTKTYSKWQAPEGSGCAGNFYAPLGVTAVKVAYTKP